MSSLSLARYIRRVGRAEPLAHPKQSRDGGGVGGDEAEHRNDEEEDGGGDGSSQAADRRSRRRHPAGGRTRQGARTQIQDVFFRRVQSGRAGKDAAAT